MFKLRSLFRRQTHRARCPVGAFVPAKRITNIDPLDVLKAD